jgi:hypothetical protein
MKQIVLTEDEMKHVVNGMKWLGDRLFKARTDFDYVEKAWEHYSALAIVLGNCGLDLFKVWEGTQAFEYELLRDNAMTTKEKKGEIR